MVDIHVEIQHNLLETENSRHQILVVYRPQEESLQTPSGHSC